MRMIGHEPLEFVRWDPAQPLAPNNIVLLSTGFIKQMDEQGRAAVVSQQLAQRIEATLRLQGSDW
jgi:hypothetical protein